MNLLPKIAVITSVLTGCQLTNHAQVTQDAATPASSNATEVGLDTITSMGQMKGLDSAVFHLNESFFVVYRSFAEEQEETTTPQMKELLALQSVDDEKSNCFLQVPGGDNATMDCDSWTFDGVARRAAKTKIVDAPIEAFATVDDLLAELEKTSDAMMREKGIKGSRCYYSDRVTEEKRNVRIEKAWLYTYARQNDEDYHLIIGSTPNIKTAKFMNVEISALPETGGDVEKLKKVRTAFFESLFSDGDIDCEKYKNWFRLEISVEGSLFFDIGHKVTTCPAMIKKHGNLATIWEIHPITSITFN